MALALSNNPAHLVQLCEQLELGNARDVPTQVAGGFHHRMWLLETDRERYAVKQLAPDTDLSNPDYRSHYDTTEAIAERFAGEGVPALHALGRYGHYLQIIDRSAYLVYPWTDAKAIDKQEVSLPHALAVADILAKIHSADIVAPHPAPLQLPVVPEEQVISLVAGAAAHELECAGQLQTLLPDFLQMLEAQQSASPVLEQHRVISHGDLDQKNVLWDSRGKPLVIDWESAGLINPSYEILLEALDWGGITTQFDKRIFEQVIARYQQAGGRLQQEFIGPAFDAIIAEWLDWLMYNLGRIVYLEDSAQKQVGAEQLELTLATILNLQQKTGALQDCARQLVRAGGKD
jgi:aminoglycoside phosphotransferase (APT) family kinase protein